MSSFGRALTLVLALLAVPATAAELRDPMRPPRGRAEAAPRPETPRPSRPDYVLESTLVGPARRSAVISGHLVAPGETLPGARVLRIEAGSVELQSGGRRLHLRLPEPVAKKTTPRGGTP